MKAIVPSKYGAPDVLQLHEVEKPVPKDYEVLIEVQTKNDRVAGVLQWSTPIDFE